MAWDPTADIVVNQTTQGVTANNLKTFGHWMDLAAQEGVKDMQAEGRNSRAFSQVLLARSADLVLGRQIADASADAIVGQTGVKAAESTPPETGVTTALAQLQSLYQQNASQSNQVLQTLAALIPLIQGLKPVA